MTARRLSPAAMQPQPLIGIFADPALDHRRNRLGRALHIDFARGVADRLYFIGQFGAKAVIGQADDPDAMYRALDLPQQSRKHRIGAGLAAEEGDLDAIGKILIDQHRDVLAVLQGLRKL